MERFDRALTVNTTQFTSHGYDSATGVFSFSVRRSDVFWGKFSHDIKQLTSYTRTLRYVCFWLGVFYYFHVYSDVRSSRVILLTQSKLPRMSCLWLIGNLFVSTGKLPLTYVTGLQPFSRIMGSLFRPFWHCVCRFRIFKIVSTVVSCLIGVLPVSCDAFFGRVVIHSDWLIVGWFQLNCFSILNSTLIADFIALHPEFYQSWSGHSICLKVHNNKPLWNVKTVNWLTA